MFTKNKVSQSMIDAVNKVLGEEPTGQEDVLLNEAGTPIKEPTSTGMKVYGRSYGNSAKAKQDQTKSSVDDLKGPKTKELMQKDKEEYEKTKGKYDEAAKPDYLDFDKDGDKKEPMKSALAAKKKVAEELKGDQHKIDANKNNKVDAHDFAILRGKKKVKEDMYFAKKLIEGMKRSDIPAYVRKARGDAPLTPAEVKSGSKDSISDPKNLAKARNEEVELDEATYDYKKAMQSQNPRIQKKGIGGAMDAATKRIKQTFKDVPRNSLEKPYKEEVEQIDEKDPCWDNYTQVGMKKKNGREVPNCVPSKGVPAAKGYKEEVELEERTMTSADKTERERIVKGMKKGLAGFKSRYGKDAKSVMYATATKQAMKEAAVDSAPITTDTLAGRMPGGKSNDFKSYKLRVRPLDKEGETIPKDATPEIIQPDETPARKSHEVKEATIAGTSGWKKMAATVTDKSGAKHSPMSRARNLAQQAFKKVQDKTKVKSEMMLGKDGGTSESKKW